MKDIHNNSTPLGGPINMNITNGDNIPSSGLCTDDFHFWGFTNKESESESKQQEPINNIETFMNLNEHFNETFKEDFNEKDDLWWIILVIVVVLILIGSGLYYISKK